MENQLADDNDLDTCNFLNRLRALQRLCSNGDARYPSGLLFIAGPDGRYNKGSINIVKYLFQGATGKYLLEGSLDDDYEPLEELVLLVQQTSVSVIWSNAAKKIIGPLLSKVPLLIEYLPTPEEEEEVDRFQSRKCFDFKRMMLEAVPSGRGVGIAVPLGYDEVHEVETWPLLQAFAIDDVFCSTGFFTARYEVVDMTEYIDVLFKSVDGFVVEKAIDILRTSVLPHVDQTVGILDASTADSRARLTAEDVAGPLDILFEFGELECAYPVDPLMRPVVYFGLDSTALGASTTPPDGWKARTIGKRSLIALVEACEPSTGLRWCRTYFLHRGKSLDYISLEGDGDNVATPSVSPDVARCVDRLEAMYGKLLVGLRAAVKAAFAVHTDVLEAGTFVQQAMGSFMKGKHLPGMEFSADEMVALDGVELLPGERLKLHMDCMNAHGQIVTIDDVDDMGGSCWTYIRVSVHGISLASGQTLSVAVGDTFLFSSFAGALDVRSAVSTMSSRRPAARLPTLAPLFADCFCATHAIPYVRLFVGPGIEDASAQQLLAATRSPHMLLSLGMGKLLDTTVTGNLTFPIIMDHPLLPFASAEFKAFSEGLLLEKLDTKCLPVLLCMNAHVERMWVIDAEECLAQAIQLTSRRDRDMPSFIAPDGNVVVLRLKEFDGQQQNRASQHSMQYNPLRTALPTALCKHEPHHIAFFIGTSSRMAPSMNSACASWRNVLRANDIQVHRGSDVVVPQGILTSFLALVDHWSHQKDSKVFEESALKLSATIVRIAEEMGSSELGSNAHVGLGFSAIRCVHALSETKRLAPGNAAAASAVADTAADLEKMTIAATSSSLSLRDRQGSGSSGVTTDVVLISGLPGSGTLAIGTQLYARLKKAAAADVSFHLIDLSFFQPSDVDGTGSTDGAQLCDYVARSLFTAAGGSVAVVVVLHSPSSHVRHSDVIQFSCSLLNPANVAHLVSVVNAASLKPASAISTRGCGYELWTACDLELCQPSVCDLAVFVDGSSTSTISCYGVFKDWLAGANPALNTVKVSPGNLRLDDDLMADILRRLSTGDRDSTTIAAISVKASPQQHPSKRLKPSRSAASIRALPDDAVWVARGLTSPPLQLRTGDTRFVLRCSNAPPSLFGKGLRPLLLSPAQATVTPLSSSSTSTGSMWSIDALASVLHNVFFPAATFSNVAVVDTWNPPDMPSSSSRGAWQRVVQLAKVKVMAERQCAAGKQELRAFIAGLLSGMDTDKNIELQKSKDMLALQAGLVSLHGVIRVRTGHPFSSPSTSSSKSSSPFHIVERQLSKLLSVEANSSSIVFRFIEGSEDPDWFTGAGYPVDTLVAFGSLGPKDEHLATQVLLACLERKLSTVPYLTPEDVSHRTMLDIQVKNQHVPLPGDVWYDGQTFVDIQGSRKVFRPDIDVLVAEYLRHKNHEIDKYNKMLGEVSAYL